MRVVITGHRPKKLQGGYNWASEENLRIMDWMTVQLTKIREDYNESVISCTGMALGIDQMFAHKCEILGIDYTAFVPCKFQEKLWPKSSIRVYRKLLESASDIVWTSNEPFDQLCMQKRNLAMRDWALKDRNHILLAVWDGSPGGTANMIKACKKMNIIYYEGVK